MYRRTPPRNAGVNHALRRLRSPGTCRELLDRGNLSDEWLVDKRSVGASKDEGRVDASKPEGVAERVFHVSVAPRLGDVVEIAVGVRNLVIDRRREPAALERERTDRGL